MRRLCVYNLLTQAEFLALLPDYFLPFSYLHSGCQEGIVQPDKMLGFRKKQQGRKNARGTA